LRGPTRKRVELSKFARSANPSNLAFSALILRCTYGDFSAGIQNSSPNCFVFFKPICGTQMIANPWFGTNFSWKLEPIHSRDIFPFAEPTLKHEK
jgi:hypothetical protein